MTDQTQTYSGSTDYGYGEAPTLDQLFRALSHPYRRRILTVLANGNHREEDAVVPTDVIPADEKRDDVVVSLHHNHLPRLQEAGYIEWESETKTIRRGSRFDKIAPLVQLMLDHRDELPADWP